MAGITVHVDLSGARRKLSKGALQRGKIALAQQAGADMNQFVPAGPPNKGHLRNTQVIAADGKNITWNTPYAHRQFTAPGGWQYTTPGTGPHWDLKAKGQYGAAWVTAFKKGMGL